jgi:hypothetical protein
MEIINNLLASMNGTLRDTGGKFTVTAMKNDLAEYVLTCLIAPSRLTVVASSQESGLAEAPAVQVSKFPFNSKLPRPTS